MSELGQRVNQKVAELLTGLYSDVVVGETSRLAQHYIEEGQPHYEHVPHSLRGVTSVHFMEPGLVVGPQKPFRSGIFRLTGVYDGKTISAPLNAILARMITVPRMIRGYIDNYPRSEDELAIYTDPPFLQFHPDELRGLHDTYFAQASEALLDRGELIRRFRLLGDVGEDVAREEVAYPARNSTQAYELFGIFHLFPSNETVDVTSTSPGVILPTEADPLRFRDSVFVLKKNLLRPTYFEMLRHSIDLGDGRRRRYFASRKGTAQNLAEYPQFLGMAKDILAKYLELGDRFEIRLGEQRDRMKLVTLIGDAGVVYSVRDPQQKDYIAHNVTVMDANEARRHKEEFEEQWAQGVPITDTNILDQLLKEAKK